MRAACAVPCRRARDTFVCQTRNERAGRWVSIQPVETQPAAVPRAVIMATTTTTTERDEVEDLEDIFVTDRRAVSVSSSGWTDGMTQARAMTTMREEEQ